MGADLARMELDPPLGVLVSDVAVHAKDLDLPAQLPGVLHGQL